MAFKRSGVRSPLAPPSRPRRGISRKKTRCFGIDPARSASAGERFRSERGGCSHLKMFRERRQFDSWMGKPEVCRVQLSRKLVQAPSSAFTEQARFGNKQSDGFISVDKALRMKRERGEVKPPATESAAAPATVSGERPERTTGIQAGKDRDCLDPQARRPAV